METSGPVRSGFAPQAADYKPPENRFAVGADLAPDKAVPATGPAEKPRNHGRSAGRERGSQDSAGRSPHDRELDFDRETRDLVYKAIDLTTGDVVWQLPSESMIRLREYLQTARRESARRQAEATLASNVDMKA